jgi:hypothetical protein
MGRASDSTSTSSQTISRKPSLKKREVKAREFSAMNVKAMATLEQNVGPFRKDKRKGSLLLGQMKIQRKKMSQPDMWLP